MIKIFIILTIYLNNSCVIEEKGIFFFRNVMTNTSGLFVICCGLAISTNNSIQAMENELAKYIDNNLYIEQENKYINSLNSNYNSLSSCIKEQLTQVDNIGIENSIYKQYIKKFVIESLDSANVLLNELIKSYKSNLYFISHEYKDYAFDNICNIYCGTYTFDKVQNAFNNAEFCKLLYNCNLYLSAILSAFSNLKNNNYKVENFDKIKDYIITIKKSMTL